MEIENLSLSQLKQMENALPQTGLGRFASRFLANSYDEFIEILYLDLDDIIYQIQENAELRLQDSEDRLTIDIKDQLCRLGYDANHDSKFRGHPDLIVKKKTFRWIGEAKIHSTYNYLWKGFLQLTTRYSNGDCNQKDGGLFLYIRNKDVDSVINKWQKYLSEKKLPDYDCKSCINRDLSFLSSHKHKVSGRIFKVRHMPVMLYFNPEDKSGKSRKT